MTEYSSCVLWTFAVFLYFVWGGWIYCCTLGSLWTLELIKYGKEECIHLGDEIPISLIAISDFNALLFLISLLIFCLEKELFYMAMICSAVATSVTQFGLHVTLFIYVNNAYWLDSYTDCDIFEETIHVSYYYLLAGITIISLSVCTPCIIGVIMGCGCCCEDVRFPNYINSLGIFGDRSQESSARIQDVRNEENIELMPRRNKRKKKKHKHKNRKRGRSDIERYNNELRESRNRINEYERDASRRADEYQIEEEEEEDTVCV